ncbi:hypothetical protein MNBD_GAMMA21-1973 [hydrothermal vent metagenome]|uniref:Uncharacterized protein n=1 Tax=hydrothermal vent metagenome TaxID=652676 RepID=A0A3B1AMK4_9ZZZZ
MNNRASYRNYLIALTLMASALLTGCGGGGGGGGGNTPPANNNADWDQMVWDQDDWS